MAIIVIKNLFEKQISTGNSVNTLLVGLQNEFVDWMHACGGKGRCTTCKFKVIYGADSLGEITQAEQKYLNKGELKEDERLACQALVLGDITIEIPDECKLPHINYSE